MKPGSQTPLTLDQLLVLASPIRVAVFGALRLMGPKTVKEVASYLGARPDALYYHFRILEEVKLLEVKEVRPAGKRREAVYGLTADQFTISSSGGDEDYGRAVMGLVDASSAYCLDRFRASSKTGAEPEPDFHLVHGRLLPHNLHRWRVELERTMILAFKDEGEQGIPVVACAMVVPIQDR